jgi:phosphohistidine swiveling domain-containing protein
LVLSYTDDFSVTWKDPARANESWVHDRLHAPWVQPPLTQALFKRIMAIAFGLPAVFVNNYGFMRNFGPPPATPEVEARGPIPIWAEDFEPHVRLACQEMRNRDYEALSTVQLAERLPQYFEETAEIFRYTTILVFAFLRPTAALITFLEAEFGEEGGLLAARLLQGFENESTTAGRGLAQLTELGAASTALSQALRSGHFDAIPDLDGGPEFLQSLNDYIAEYGWRADSWYMAHLPTWAEDPRLAMALIGRYVDDPSRSPIAGLERSAAIREAAVAEAEARLAGDKLIRFHELLAASNDHVAISESRASWQLQISGSVRVPTMTLGRRLVATGAIAEPNDIFCLTLDQVQAASRDPAKSWQATVAAVKTEIRRCERLTPPVYIGMPPSMSSAPPDLQAVMRHLRGYGVTLSEDVRRVNGMGASKGIARGRARVIFGLEESGRLQPGDILVCRTTAPPWTSLFAMAGGIVTDAGGLLSHSAICAREYGIPAVVATQVGTARIPDGAIIEIDGEKGTVTIEG